MDKIRVGMKLNIKRSNGRILETSVIGLNATLRSVTVHWVEDGETKGKLMDFDSLVELNPQLLDKNNNVAAPDEKRYNLRNPMQGQSKEGQSKRRKRDDDVDNKKEAVVELELPTSESESDNEETERPSAKSAKPKSKRRRVVRTASDSYSSDDYDSDWLPSKRGNGFAPNKNRGKPKTKH